MSGQIPRKRPASEHLGTQTEDRRVRPRKDKPSSGRHSICDSGASTTLSLFPAVSNSQDEIGGLFGAAFKNAFGLPGLAGPEAVASWSQTMAEVEEIENSANSDGDI